MSTTDVPGYAPENNDELHVGCWAYHEDGSHLLVQGIENHKVIYSIFDMAEQPPQQFLDAMSMGDFMAFYSYDPKSGPYKNLKLDKKTRKPKKESGDGDEVPNIKWTWKDKTPFPWEKIMELGFSSGVLKPDLDTASEQGDTRALRLREKIDFGVNELQEPPEGYDPEAKGIFLGANTAAKKIRDLLGLRAEALSKTDVGAKLPRTSQAASKIIRGIRNRLRDML